MMRSVRLSLGRRRGIAIAAIVSMAVIAMIDFPSFPFRGLLTSPDSTTDGGGDGDADGGDLRTLRVRDPFRLRGAEGEEITLDAYDEEDNYDAAFLAGTEDNYGAAAFLAGTLPPYTLEDALAESNVWAYTFVLVVYDPREDQFVGLYNKNHEWKAGNKKLWHALRVVAYVLRRLFPERFTPDAPEFVFAMSSGDYPHVHRHRLPHMTGAAPVLMFGSAFRDPNMYRNMIAMPMPVSQHLDCYVEWLEREKVCAQWRPNSDGGLLEFGETAELRWDELIPQVVWRGTDFSYLPSLQDRSSMLRKPLAHVVVPKNETGRRFGAIQALNSDGEYDTLVPRWKAVALTASAELEAQGSERPPWADMKFSSCSGKGKAPALGSAKYRAWEAIGIGVAKGMGPADLARYRYHIDLGGGGGTTWTGTLEKLAMPGLLFHHVTPTKDYFHHRLRAWGHYIPVAPDLTDLRRKFEWAESHPAQAHRIAEAGANLARQLGTPEGFREMFREHFVEPLRRTILAYQPVGVTRPGTTWREVLESLENCRVMPVIECSGKKVRHSSCTLVGGEDVLAWQRTKFWRGDRRV